MNQLQSWSFTQSNICKTSFVPTIFLTPIPVHPRNWDHFICSWIKQKLFDFLSIRMNQFMTRNLSEDEKKLSKCNYIFVWFLLTAKVRTQTEFIDAELNCAFGTYRRMRYLWFQIWMLHFGEHFFLTAITIRPTTFMSKYAYEQRQTQTLSKCVPHFHTHLFCYYYLISLFWSKLRICCIKFLKKKKSYNLERKND